MAVKATVFVVDDEKIVRDSLAALLQVVGYETRLFAKADDFLEKYDPDAIGCILVDIRMPGMDGLSMLRRLAELNSHAPVLVMTGHADSQLAQEALTNGAADFIEKPFDHEDLIDRLERACRQDKDRVHSFSQGD